MTVIGVHFRSRCLGSRKQLDVFCWVRCFGHDRRNTTARWQLHAACGGFGVAVTYACVQLQGLVAMATRSGLAPFIKLASRIRSHQVGINAALVHGLSNARVESANNKLRLLTRLAFGFHSPAPLISLALLKLGGLCPPLPGRL